MQQKVISKRQPYGIEFMFGSLSEIKKYDNSGRK